MEVSLSPRARAVVIWIGVIAGGFVLLEAAHALRPFAWAIITAYILHPFVSFVHRKTRLPKQLITTWLYLMLGLLITILAINLAPPLVEQFDGLKDQLPNASTEIEDWLIANQRDQLDRLGIEPDFLQGHLDEASQELTQTLSDAALPVLFGTVSVAIELIIYLVASFYFIVYGDRFVLAIRTLLHRRYHGEFDRLLTQINSTLGAYIRGQALLVAIMTAASFTVLYTLGIQYAAILAIATGFLELIPLAGPWMAGAVAVSVALFQDSTPFGWTHLTLALVIALAYFALRQLEDAFVIPTVIGRIVHLHPLLVIFAIVVGTSLGGVLGLILAVPIAAVTKIVATYLYDKLMIRETRHIEVVVDRDHLGTLVDQFDQRVNWTMVLLIEPGTLSWDDLPLVRRLAEAAAAHSVALSAVTPDGIAGSLFTAVGISTSTIPIGQPLRAEAMVG
jgi:predicted PurR-regulated permease PerM